MRKNETRNSEKGLVEKITEKAFLEKENDIKDGGKEDTSAIYFASILLITAMILALPFAIRFFHDQPLVMGTGTAKILALVRHADLSQIMVQDPFTHEKLGISLLVRALSLSSLPDAAIIFIPPLIGIISVAIWWSTLKRFFSVKKTLMIIALILLNPLFIRIFTECSLWPFMLFLGTLALWALLSEKHAWSMFIASIMIFEDPFSGLFTALILIIILASSLQYEHDYHNSRQKNGCKAKNIMSPPRMIAVDKTEKTKRNRNTLIFRFILLACAVFFVSLFLSPQNPQILKTPFAGISDLGAGHGISSAIILMSVIGGIVIWRKNPHTSLIMIYACMILGLLWLPARVMLIPAFGIISTSGITFLATRKWSYDMMKQFTLLLTICIIFISLSTFFSLQITQSPTKEMADALGTLTTTGNMDIDRQTDEEAILARPEIGEFIEYYSGRKVIIDDAAKNRGDQMWPNLERALLSRNPEETADSFNSIGTRTFLIDPELETTLKERGEGILFLINVTDMFKQVNDDTKFRLYIMQPPTENIEGTNNAPVPNPSELPASPMRIKNNG